jgi:hypothetical protein
MTSNKGQKSSTANPAPLARFPGKAHNQGLEIQGRSAPLTPFPFTKEV